MSRGRAGGVDSASGPPASGPASSTVRSGLVGSARSGPAGSTARSGPAAASRSPAASGPPAEDAPAWWARGLLFESCNCQIVCPGHVHFSQNCTHERCVGYWALRFDEGRYGGTRLDGVRAVVAFECPQLMIAGGWTEVVLIDEQASADQRVAVEAILRGEAGGPWQVLARFVSDWLPTRFVPIEIEDAGKVKRVRVGSAARPADAGGYSEAGGYSDAGGATGSPKPASPGDESAPLLDASVEDIRGWDRDLPVTLRNMFNQIHAASQTIARGETRGDIGGIRLRNEGTHGLHSRFEWRVGRSEHQELDDPE